MTTPTPGIRHDPPLDPAYCPVQCHETGRSPCSNPVPGARSASPWPPTTSAPFPRSRFAGESPTPRPNRPIGRSWCDGSVRAGPDSCRTDILAACIHGPRADRRKLVPRTTFDRCWIASMLGGTRRPMITAETRNWSLDNARLRAAYLEEVPTRSAHEVPAASGVNPKNPSEPASRWKREDRRVFAVAPRRARSVRRTGGSVRGRLPAAVIKQVLHELPPTATDWQIAIWFASGNVWLDGAEPRHQLDAPDEVLEAARRLADATDRLTATLTACRFARRPAALPRPNMHGARGRNPRAPRARTAPAPARVQRVQGQPQAVLHRSRDDGGRCVPSLYGGIFIAAVYETIASTTCPRTRDGSLYRWTGARRGAARTPSWRPCRDIRLGREPPHPEATWRDGTFLATP